MLSNRARKWLNNLRKSRKKDDLIRCNVTEAFHEVATFCKEHNIPHGKTINQKEFLFDRQAFREIKKLCDFTQDLNQLDRHQATNFTENEKQAGIAPKDYRVLAAFPNQQLSHYSAPQLNIELDIRQLDLTVFSHFIAIENRDSFNDWHKYQLADSFENPLVLYRGDGEEGKWFTKLKSDWAKQKPSCPQIYFGDFDLPGIKIGLEYDGLLLPSLSWLAKNCIASHFEATHVRYEKQLNIECPIGWQDLLQLMLKNQKALRQQWMFDVPLAVLTK